MSRGLAIAYSVKRKNAQKKASGGEVENEDLNPQHAAPSMAKDKMMQAGERLGFKAQEYEDLPMSKVDPASIDAYKPRTMPLRKEPMIAQDDLPLSEQEAYFAKGGESHPIVMAIMRKRGPRTTPAGYAEGDMVDTSSQSAKPNMKENYGNNLQKMAHEGRDQDHTFNFPGLAEGGPTDDMGLNDQEVDRDHFLSEFDEEDFDPKDERKMRLRKIMSDIHAKHYGKS